MFQILLARRGSLLLSGLLAIVSAGSGLVPYLVVWAIAARIWGGEPLENLTIFFATLIALSGVVMKALCSALSGQISHLAAYATLADLRLRIAKKLTTIPLATFHDRKPSDLKRVMAEDVDQLEDAIAHAVPDFAAGLAVPLLSGLVLMAVDWRLGLASMAMFPLLIATFQLALRAAGKRSGPYLEALVAMKATAGEFVQGMKVIRAFLRGDAMLDRVSSAADRLATTGNAYATTSLGWMALFYVGLRANLLVILPVGGFLLTTGSVSPPDLLLALLVGMGMNAPAFRLVMTAGGFFWKFKASGARIAAVLDTPDLVARTEPARPNDATVTFENVALTAGDRQILRDVTFTARPGTVTALVGPSGAGKTSLLRLLSRDRDPDAGRILVGGVDLRDMEPEALLQGISTVFQDAWLMNDTIRANIRMGRPDASEQDVADAAKAARVTEFAPDLDMPAGESGRLLSGGQRQRVMLARAILSNRPIVLLDEATASLDPENEAQVLDAMRELERGRTVIVVAHRLHTIREAAQILYIEDGTIQASGTHDDLLATCPGYARAWANYETVDGWSLQPNSGSAPEVPEDAPQPSCSPNSDQRLVLTHSTGQSLLRLTGPMRGLLLTRAFPLLVLESLAMAAPILAVWLVLSALLEGDLSATTLAVACAIMLAAFAIQFLANHEAYRRLWQVQTGAVANLQKNLASRLVAAPLGLVTTRDTGGLETILSRTATELNFITPAAQLARAVVTPAAIAIVMAVIDWRLALVALASLIPFAATVAIGDGIYHRTMSRLHVAREALSSRVLDFVEGMPVLRSYGSGATGLSSLAGAIDAYRGLSFDITRDLSRTVAIGWLLLDLGFVALVGVGGWMVVAGATLPLTWLLFLVIALAFYGPIADAFELVGIWRQQQTVIERVRTVLDLPALPEPTRPLNPASLELRFEKVGFSYATAPALSDVSVTFEPGKIHALTGMSGAGKSTMMNLIARFWDPDEGRITVGGVNLRDLSPTLRSSLFSIVFQDTFLFDDTVHANIALGRPGASREAVEAAAKRALCHDFVSGLENGYDTRLGERGGRLSGGERQRIAIARALLKDAPIVLLDEATASIDPEGEAQIRQAIAELCRSRTVIVIAHRPNTIRSVDKVIRLDNGRVAEISPAP